MVVKEKIENCPICDTKLQNGYCPSCHVQVLEFSESNDYYIQEPQIIKDLNNNDGGVGSTSYNANIENNLKQQLDKVSKECDEAINNNNDTGLPENVSDEDLQMDPLEFSEFAMTCDSINDLFQNSNNEYVINNLTVTQDNTGSFVISDIQTQEEYVVNNLDDLREVLANYNVFINFSDIENFDILKTIGDKIGDRIGTQGSLERGKSRIALKSRLDPVKSLVDEAKSILDQANKISDADNARFNRISKLMSILSAKLETEIKRLDSDPAAARWKEFMESNKLIDTDAAKFEKDLSELIKKLNDSFDEKRNKWNKQLTDKIDNLTKNKVGLVRDSSDKSDNNNGNSGNKNNNNNKKETNKNKAKSWVGQNYNKFGMSKDDKKNKIDSKLNSANDNESWSKLRDLIKKGIDESSFNDEKKTKFKEAVDTAQFSETLFNKVINSLNFAEENYNGKSAINSQLKIVQDTEFGICGEDKFGSLWDLKTGKCLFKSEQGSISEEDVEEGQNSDILDEDEEFGDDFDDEGGDNWDSEGDDWSDEEDSDDDWDSDEDSNDDWEDEESDEEFGDDEDLDEESDEEDFSEKQFSEDDSDDDLDEDLDEESDEEDEDDESELDEETSDIEENEDSSMKDALDSALGTIDKMANKLVKLADK